MQRNLECLDVGTGDPTRLPLPTAHREQLVPGALEHWSTLTMKSGNFLTHERKNLRDHCI